MSGRQNIAATRPQGATDALSGPGWDSGPSAASKSATEAHRASEAKPALILVTGFRKLRDQQLVDHALNQAWADLKHRGFQWLVVIHGACATGADRMADGWARRHANTGVTVRRFRISDEDWTAPCRPECAHGPRKPRTHRGGTYCPMVGPLRNQDMVDHVVQQSAPHGALALVFTVRVDGRAVYSPGTMDCRSRIERACVPYRMLTEQRTTAVA